MVGLSKGIVIGLKVAANGLPALGIAAGSLAALAAGGGIVLSGVAVYALYKKNK